MKKIIFGITGLTLGGAERVLVDISNQLVEQYDITIFTLYGKGELESELDPKIHHISLMESRYNELTKFQAKVLLPLKVLFQKKKIFQKYINQEDYAAQIAFLEGPVTRIFSSKTNRKKIAWIHNDISQVFGKGFKSKIKRILDRNIYEKFDSLVFVSMDNMHQFNKLYDDMDLPHETVIHNYIDAKRILELAEEPIENQFDPEEINLLQVSRLVKQKAILRLLSVHQELITQGKKHHIYLIGDGPEKQKIEKEIKDKQLENTFTLLGAKTNPYPYMKLADYFCLFSYYEGFPMTVVEAEILQKNILITNTAAREALLGYDIQQYRVVSNDEKGIKEAIQFAIKEKTKMQTRETIISQYQGKKIIQKIIDLIENDKK